MSCNTSFYNLRTESSLLRRLRLNESDESILSDLKILEENKKASQELIDNAFTVAVRRSTTTIAKELIRLGADINHQGKNSWTPLHDAIDAGNLEAVCMLLFHDVDVSKCSDMSPLFRAMFYKRLDIVTILSEYCFDEPACIKAVWILANLMSPFAFNLEFNQYVDFHRNFRWGDICHYLVEVPHTSDIFKGLCPLIDIDNLKHLNDFLFHFTSACVYDPPDFVKCFFAILESPIISTLVDLYNASLPLVVEGEYFISSLIYYYFDHDIKELSTALYACMSLGFKIIAKDFVYLYNYFGYGTELEALIYAGDLKWLPSDRHLIYPIPSCIAFFNRTYNKYTLVEYLPSDSGKFEVLDVLRFFSVPKSIIEGFEVDAIQDEYHEEYLEKASNVPDVPSLVQLCRDNIRMQLINSYRYKKKYEYVDAIKKLQIPQVLRDILLFKKPLYFD